MPSPDLGGARASKHNVADAAIPGIPDRAHLHRRIRRTCDQRDRTCNQDLRHRRLDRRRAAGSRPGARGFDPGHAMRAAGRTDHLHHHDQLAIDQPVGRSIGQEPLHRHDPAVGRRPTGQWLGFLGIHQCMARTELRTARRQPGQGARTRLRQARRRTGATGRQQLRLLQRRVSAQCRPRRVGTLHTVRTFRRSRRSRDREQATDRNA